MDFCQSSFVEPADEQAIYHCFRCPVHTKLFLSLQLNLMLKVVMKTSDSQKSYPFLNYMLLSWDNLSAHLFLVRLQDTRSSTVQIQKQ